MTTEEILRFALLTGQITYMWCPDNIYDMSDLADKLINEAADGDKDAQEWLGYYNRLKN